MAPWRAVLVLVAVVAALLAATPALSAFDPKTAAVEVTKKAIAKQLVRLANMDIQPVADEPDEAHPYIRRSSRWGGITTCQHKLNMDLADGSGTQLVPLHTMWKIVIVGRAAWIKAFWFYDYITVSAYRERVNLTDLYSKDYYLRSPNTGRIFQMPRAASHFRFGVKTWPDPIVTWLILDEIDRKAGEFEVLALHSDEYCPVLAHKPEVRNFDAKPEAKGPAKSVFVMTPMFEGAEMVVPMLHWNIKWHEAFGVSQHVLYSYGRLGHIAEDPRIQELVKAGKLTIVLWDSTANHYIGNFDMHDWADKYEMQPLLDNHALMAFWPSDTYVLTADVDEFIYTHRPMSIPQLMEECGAPMYGSRSTLDTPLASLCNRRTGVWCLDCHRGDLPLCHGSQGTAWCEAPLWMNTTQESHPLERYAWSPPQYDLHLNLMGTKCLSRIPVVASLDTHHTWAEYPAVVLWPPNNDTSCFGWLHVANLFTLRFQPNVTDPEPFRLTAAPMAWPLRTARSVESDDQAAAASQDGQGTSAGRRLHQQRNQEHDLQHGGGREAVGCGSRGRGSGCAGRGGGRRPLGTWHQ